MGFWNRLFYEMITPEPEEFPERMPQDAAGLPWCQDDYDPAIDRGPNALSETGVPLPPYDEKERALLKKYLEEIPLPGFFYTWRLEGKKSTEWKQALLHAPVYPFLKDSPEMQALFKKTVQAAVQELAGYPEKGEYFGKAGSRAEIHKSGFHLLMRLTGRDGKPCKADFSISCNGYVPGTD